MRLKAQIIWKYTNGEVQERLMQKIRSITRLWKLGKGALIPSRWMLLGQVELLVISRWLLSLSLAPCCCWVNIYRGIACMVQELLACYHWIVIVRTICYLQYTWLDFLESLLERWNGRSGGGGRGGGGSVCVCVCGFSCSLSLVFYVAQEPPGVCQRASVIYSSPFIYTISSHVSLSMCEEQERDTDAGTVLSPCHEPK